jgi:hypothetical protein
MTWFVQESGHPGFKDIAIPEKCLQPLLIEDEETKNNMDYASNKNVETMYESGTFLLFISSRTFRRNVYNWLS